MAVNQISVFTESRVGHLTKILKLLRDGGINVRGYSVSDTGEYGIARFIVDDYETVCRVLKDNNAAYTVKKVLCIKLVDEPGELARVTSIFAQAQINVRYSYSMISTYIIVGVDDADAVQNLLAGEDLQFVNQEDIARI